MNPNNLPKSCLCGSGHSYADCCGVYHSGDKTAPTPETLMRSRYSAYVLGLGDYLLSTWAPETRPSSPAAQFQEDARHTRWLGLQIIDAPLPGGDEGQVEFRARYVAADEDSLATVCFLQERSQFVKIDGGWCYVNGDVKEGVEKYSRNDPCPCGSGIKLKKCHV